MFDPHKSYDENYSAGPQQEWVVGKRWPQLRYLEQPDRFVFLDKPLHLPFGIPAGPLLHAQYMRCAQDAGFCMPTYKTVRSRAYASHPLPNILEIAETAQATGPQKVETAYAHELKQTRTQDTSRGFSITNSFGVPSQPPTVWQPDVRCVPLRSGYLNALSFQPTMTPSFEDFLNDARLIAKQASETTAEIFEINLSCPNESGMPLYHDELRAIAVLRAIRDELPHARLIAKLGSLSVDQTLSFVRRSCEIIDGISALNTIRCHIVDAFGNPALGPEREFGGVCGQLIFARGVFMIKSLASARRRLGLSPRRFGLIGVGGVFTPAHVETYLSSGADVVQAATGAMWNLSLAACVAAHLRVRTERIDL